MKHIREIYGKYLGNLYMEYIRNIHRYSYIEKTPIGGAAAGGASVFFVSAHLSFVF